MITNANKIKCHGLIMKCEAWNIAWKWPIHVYFELVLTLSQWDQYNNLNIPSVISE